MTSCVCLSREEMVSDELMVRGDEIVSGEWNG